MKTRKITAYKPLALILIVLSLVIASMFSLIGCANSNSDKEPTPPTDEELNDTSNHILKEDGTYEMTGMQSKIPMHPENFGDTLVVEKQDGIYYVTIEILNNKKVERLYWNGRKDKMTSDAKITVDGEHTKYMFAFTDTDVQKKLDFHIGGGKMPLDPSLGFKIDFENLTKVSDEVADVERPELFL